MLRFASPCQAYLSPLPPARRRHASYAGPRSCSSCSPCSAAGSTLLGRPLRCRGTAVRPRLHDEGRSGPSGSHGSIYVADRAGTTSPTPTVARRPSWPSATGCSTDPGHLGRSADQHRHPDARRTARSGSPPGPSTTGPSREPWSRPRNRGVSVQVVAAKAPNKDTALEVPAQAPRRSKLYRPGYPRTRDTVSFARECRGSCRGPGGTPHAKYFLFDKIGRGHAALHHLPDLDEPDQVRLPGQWNQATGDEVQGASTTTTSVSSSRPGSAGRSRNPYRVTQHRLGSPTTSSPVPARDAAQDPVMQNLGAVALHRRRLRRHPNHRTRIRIIQYAMYGDRGVWIAKRLRALWKPGCDIRIIYGLVTPPGAPDPAQRVRTRARSRCDSRSPRTRSGEINKYNHSKWMTITGNWNGMSSAWVDLQRFGQLVAVGVRRRRADAAHPQPRADQALPGGLRETWKQKTSEAPARTLSASGRALPSRRPRTAPTWGRGSTRHAALRCAADRARTGRVSGHD